MTTSQVAGAATTTSKPANAVQCAVQNATCVISSGRSATVWFANAWPQGFQNGQIDACASGLVRHSNGGGCVPSGTPTSVYVGPYAQVLPGASVSGTARIEDQAIVANGTVSGGTAQVRTSFYPLGFFESGQAASGSLNLYGDVEYRGVGLNLGSGNRSGFVDATSTVGQATDINSKTRPTWRP